MKDFAKSIRTGNADLGLRPIVSELTKDIAKIYEENGKDREKTKRELIEKHHFTEKQAEESLRKIVGNSKVGNGSGSWRGKFYEDSAGNSASVEKRGDAWEVYWEDARGYGKPLGKYKDEKTAREVAEEAVESEMPDRIRASYKSKALNEKVGNYDAFLSNAKAFVKDWLRNSKIGNSKVGNADIYSGSYIIMSDDGNVWFRDEHDEVSIKNIDSWANERVRQYQASIDEIKKGVQEAKQVAKKYGLL